MFQNWRTAYSISTRWGGVKLTWKITGAVLATFLVFGILTMSMVYVLTNRLLNEQIDQRALDLTKNLGDAAVGHIATKNSLALHAIVARYTLHEGVAYAFIRSRDGKTLAHSLGGQFPKELQTEASVDERNLVRRRNLIFRNRPVFETVVPILAGQLGSAHVSIWGDIVEAEIHRDLLPIIGLIGFLFLIAGTISTLSSRQIVKRITRLQSIADTMSKGNLEDPVGVGSGDEIDQLALSLERMRTSLKAAMMRLRHADLRPAVIRQEGDGKNEQASA
jgi:HAMP domain-containing protein